MSFSRYIRSGQSPPQLAQIDRLRVLVIPARPSDLPSSDYDDGAAILSVISSARVQVDELRPATLEALSRYLSTQPGEAGPHILHFDGHGAFGRHCPNGAFNCQHA